MRNVDGLYCQVGVAAESCVYQFFIFKSQSIFKQTPKEMELLHVSEVFV